MPVPRVVVDANVIVSALYKGGTPEAVILAAERGEVELFVSRFIMEEVSTALVGPKFGWTAEEVVDALRGLPLRVTDPGPAYLAVARDPADNHVLECAVAAAADYLVTGDRDLLDLGTYAGIVILKPQALLTRLRSSTTP